MADEKVSFWCAVTIILTHTKCEVRIIGIRNIQMRFFQPIRSWLTIRKDGWLVGGSALLP